jgi:hypothetical protein
MVGRNTSLKNPVTPLGIDSGTVQLVAQYLNHYATPGPIIIIIIIIIQCNSFNPEADAQAILTLQQFRKTVARPEILASIVSSRCSDSCGMWN